MRKIRIEDLVFWILIAAIIGIVIWLLSGSPTDTSAIISITVFVAASEILIWKNLFSIDKKTSLGFEKIKNDIDNRFLEINNQLIEIKNLIEKSAKGK